VRRVAYVSEKLQHVPPRDSYQYYFIDLVNLLLRRREIQLEFSRQLSVLLSNGPHEKGYVDKVLPEIVNRVNEAFGIVVEEKTPEETVDEAVELFKMI